MTDAAGFDRFNDPRRPHRLLISFHYARKMNLGEVGKKWWPHHPVRIFGDSGAFSAMSLGAPITVDEYADWLAENRTHLEVYSNLDVIGDAGGTAKNQALLERKGFSPLPVFHISSPLSELEKLIDAGHPYICLGGLVGRDKALQMRFAIQCFKLARSKGKGTQFHGFGLTTQEAIMGLPWYSVDSSSWGTGFRYARAALFDAAKGKFVAVAMFSDDVLKHARLIRTYGVDPETIRDRKKYHHSIAAKLAALSWRALEGYCRRRHGEVYLPGSAPGPHHYMVAQPKEAQRASDVNAALANATGGGMHLYLANTAPVNHSHANAAMQSAIGGGKAAGLHLYLADKIDRHGLANEAIGGGKHLPRGDAADRARAGEPGAGLNIYHAASGGDFNRQGDITAALAEQVKDLKK